MFFRRYHKHSSFSDKHHFQKTHAGCFYDGSIAEGVKDENIIPTFFLEPVTLLPTSLFNVLFDFLLLSRFFQIFVAY